MYAPTGTGDLHLDQYLTNISVGWPQPGYVGEALAPAVPVGKVSDKYPVFGRETWLPEYNDLRAPATQANEIPGARLSKDTYYCQEHALQIPVADEERENLDNVVSPDRDATELVTSKIILSREVAIQTLATTAANYAAGLSVTLSGTTQWSDYINSTPIADIKTGRRAINAKIFMDPNLGIFPYQVMSILEDHPDIIERIKYSERAILTPDIIAAVFGLARVIIPGTAIGSGGPSGNAIVGSYLWGKDVILAWVPDNPGLRTPAFMYEFVQGFSGKVMITERWREGVRVADLIRVRRRYDLKMVGTEINPASGDFGKAISGYIIKAAVA